MRPATLERARAAKRHVVELLADLPELEGVGVTFLDDGFAVKVNLRRMPLSCDIPAEVDGVPILVEVVGPMRAG